MRMPKTDVRERLTVKIAATDETLARLKSLGPKPFGWTKARFETSEANLLRRKSKLEAARNMIGAAWDDFVEKAEKLASHALVCDAYAKVLDIGNDPDVKEALEK